MFSFHLVLVDFFIIIIIIIIGLLFSGQQKSYICYISKTTVQSFSPRLGAISQFFVPAKPGPHLIPRV